MFTNIAINWTEALTRGLREEGSSQRLLGALRDMAERSSAMLEALSGGETDPAFPLS